MPSQPLNIKKNWPSTARLIGLALLVVAVLGHAYKGYGNAVLGLYILAVSFLLVWLVNKK